MSGESVLEVELPTGYNLLESEAEKLIQSDLHPTLRDERTIEGKTFWFFDHVSFSLEFCGYQYSVRY
jgi:hypothetical protein